MPQTASSVVAAEQIALHRPRSTGDHRRGARAAHHAHHVSAGRESRLTSEKSGNTDSAAADLRFPQGRVRQLAGAGLIGEDVDTDAPPEVICFRET